MPGDKDNPNESRIPGFPRYFRPSRVGAPALRHGCEKLLGTAHEWPGSGIVSGTAVGVVDLVLQIALGVALTAWVVSRDMRRLPAQRFARSWNEASFWSAVVAFGPLCIPVHFLRTRRTVLGFVLGLAWMAAVLAAISLAGTVVEWVTEALA